MISIKRLSRHTGMSVFVVLALMVVASTTLALDASLNSSAEGAAQTTAFEAWITPSVGDGQDGLMHADGTLYVRPSSQASEILDLGNYLAAGPCDFGDKPGLVAYSMAEGSSVVEIAPALVATAVTRTGRAPLEAALIASGRTYSQSGAMIDVAASPAPGSTTSEPVLLAQTQLPGLPSDAVAGIVPGYVKGIARPNESGHVSSYVLLDGRVLGFVANGRAAAVVDLDTGKASLLTGFSALGHAAVGGDGYLYAVGWRFYDDAFSIKVLRINPSDMAVESSYDTELLPGTLCASAVLPRANGAVVMLAEGERGDSVQQYVFIADENGLSGLARLPEGTGLYMGSGTEDTILLYGGPARNAVSRLDLTTGTLTEDLASLRAPEGSTVVVAGELEE